MKHTTATNTMLTKQAQLPLNHSMQIGWAVQVTIHFKDASKEPEVLFVERTNYRIAQYDAKLLAEKAKLADESILRIELLKPVPVTRPTKQR